MPPSVVEVTDLPRCDPCVSSVRVVQLGFGLVVMYESFRLDDDPDFTVFEFLGWTTLLAYGPNDEALHNHPLCEHGLQPYAIQEVLDSPWRESQQRLNHNRGLLEPPMVAKRHFFMAMKENSLECLAAAYRLVGRFGTRKEAMAAAMQLVC